MAHVGCEHIKIKGMGDTMQRCLAVIPARIKSSRLPGKPLKDICGKSLVQRVWEQASKAARISKVVVASDDQKIIDLALGFGAKALLTGAEHETGTDRVAEVARRLESAGEKFDLIVNAQGDLPFINPKVIDEVVTQLESAPASTGMSTVATPIVALDEFERNSSVKVALGLDNHALYFSRAPIPNWRDRPTDFFASDDCPYGYKHIGLYVFRAKVLAELSSMRKVIVEERESLEQLRALANGIKIKVAIVSRELLSPAIEVDTAEDLKKAIEYAKSLSL